MSNRNYQSENLLLDSQRLTREIQQAAIARFSQDAAVAVNRGIRFATAAHKDDQRVAMVSGDKSVQLPYVVHPLRNTVRIARWGANDADVLIASLLHDVVEDHPYELAGMPVRKNDAESEEIARKVALELIADRFNSDVEQMVERMSNPIIPNFFKVPVDERNAQYAEHVKEAISNDARVLVLKFADFADNALAPHFGVISKQRQRRSAKYALLVPIFRQALEEDRSGGALLNVVSRGGAADIAARLNGAEDFLNEILNSEVNSR